MQAAQKRWIRAEIHLMIYDSSKPDLLREILIRLVEIATEHTIE